MSIKYTQEQVEWLKENAMDFYIEELTELFNASFNTDFTCKSLKRTMEHRKIPRKLHNKNDNLTRKEIFEDYHFEWARTNRNHYKTLADFYKAFNKRFNLNVTFNSFKSAMHRNGIYDINHKYPKKYTQEENEWIINNYEKYIESSGIFSSLKFVKDFNEKFNADIRLKDLPNKFRTLGMKKPKSLGYYDRYPIGYEMKYGSDMTWLVKVSNNIRDYGKYSITLNYRKKAHVLYEKYHNVKVDDENEIVIHLDNNKNNFEKENLYKLSRKAYKIYNASRYNNQSLQTKLNALKVSEILQIIKEN